jgi:hypothetical protein
MKTKNKILGIKHIVSKKTGKHWTLYYVDITDGLTEGIAVAPVWAEGEPDFELGDMIDVVYFKGQYFAM